MIRWAPTMVKGSKRYSTSRDLNSALQQFTTSHFKSEIWRCPFDTIRVTPVGDRKCSKIRSLSPSADGWEAVETSSDVSPTETAVNTCYKSVKSLK